jgi:hypothetical protein
MAFAATLDAILLTAPTLLLSDFTALFIPTFTSFDALLMPALIALFAVLNPLDTTLPTLLNPFETAFTAALAFGI